MLNVEDLELESRQNVLHLMDSALNLYLLSLEIFAALMIELAVHEVLDFGARHLRLEQVVLVRFVALHERLLHALHLLLQCVELPRKNFVV